MTGEPAPSWLHDLASALAEAPVPAMLRPPAGAGRPSAVLVLFGDGAPGPDSATRPDASVRNTKPDPDLLLIQRSPGLRRHGGQPAFPGGAIEPADASPVEAALREAAEEVGLDPSGVDVVGIAPELFISRSGFRVIPVLGWWRRPVAVRVADPAEVAAVARVRISELTDRANRLTIRHPSGFIGPAFKVRGMLVWGFTAGLINMLLSLGGWERPWDASRIEDLPPEALGLVS
ncbi:MAG TPA: CoA pyrophosphatase [Streptosporangiaceae bacterium]|jgi:8-oxo-dGTP pyrophosphatase MutT (NUDIX family)|nr:CoA pyrophosphatase [Streptosporangiaceae bacterium]